MSVLLGCVLVNHLLLDIRCHPLHLTNILVGFIALALACSEASLLTVPQLLASPVNLLGIIKILLERMCWNALLRLQETG